MSESNTKIGLAETLKKYLIEEVLLIEEGGKWITKAIWNIIRNYSFCVMLYIFNMHLTGATQVMTSDALSFGLTIWIVWMIAWHGFKIYYHHKHPK